MGLIKGGALRLLQTALYFLAFCCAAIILGFYGYFLSVLADRDLVISRENKAITGISGAGVLYTIFAVVLTCCLAGVTFFSLLGLILDVLFIGGFIAIAVLTRDATDSCSGIISTPLGRGPADFGVGFDTSGTNTDNQITYGVKFRTACRFNKACFAVSIIGAFIFLITALMQIALTRHHKKEKRYGPGPSNNYTSGFGKHAPAADTRPSHETGYTGTTMGGGAGGIYDDKLTAPAPLPTQGGYHTGPAGTHGYTHGTATNY